ncbi:FAD-dependent monooxygenase [Ovoidimarina sediminis]|uniref:FAD-dependent monooxygenase n=1 Tax=Ovoidimarina sediminis TaxID=3079856 RepID=UPI002914A5FC|nr:FAD-dependent monooxygenase [Rhodophyticola sp. MJ-SS7]MDU8944880.1 FAD-dependent monooxygenase [Rhodophyticola sp. MJ-SS7]
MTLAEREISVVGGGVAGLAVARACAVRRALVTLTEQAPEIKEVGAGLQISPNGYRVLHALGLALPFRAIALKANGVVLRKGRSGREVLKIDLSGAEVPYHFVHRADLIQLLLDGARSAGVQILLDTRTEPGDAPGLTIAADGLHSEFRARIEGGPREPKFTGQVAWRAVIPEDPSAPPVAEVFMGPGRHLVSYPLRGGRRNIVAVEERTGWVPETWHKEDDPDHLREAFARFGGPVRDWLDRVEQVNLWGLFRHPVAKRWFDDGAVLVGDAAHPMLPFLAQGANMALEDIWVVADRLERMDQDAALASYRKARRARVSRVVKVSLSNARNYHLRSPLAEAAHVALRVNTALNPRSTLGQFDWLYGHDVTAAR